VQRRLAAIRTDLDSFSDTEAYALMVSAYRMTDEALRSGTLGFTVTGTKRAPWRFLAAAGAVADPDDRSQLMRQLSVAHQIGFKVWRLSRRLQLALSVAVMIAGSLLFYTWTTWRDVRIASPTLWQLLFLLLLFEIIQFGVPLLRRFHIRKSFQEIVIGIGMATVGFVAARLHLHLFDKLFLWQGRLRAAGIAAATERMGRDAR
jgi:hypothetical protein